MVDVDSYLADIDPETFDLGDYLRAIDPAHIELFLQDSDCRRALTKYDPLLFAVLYFGKSITDSNTGTITFADMHFEVCRLALRWTLKHEPMDDRNAVLAPREAGKSTWLFKILPLWAVAHGHIKFVAAFTSTGPQAARWFTNVQRELDSNELLRLDYPDLCMPAVRASTGRAFTDTKTAYSSRSGATFFASGIDSSNLGLNVDDARPDLILFDDIEPDESNYSAYQKTHRLITVVDTCMGMNVRAHVMFVGTVVMLGSIFHDFVTYNDGELSEDNEWVAEQKIRVHHFEPFVATDSGRRSAWPARWSVKFLESIEHTVTYAKNWLNRPISRGGEYWTLRDFAYGRIERPALTILSIDPALKDKKTNDYTAMSVVSYDPDWKNADDIPGRFEVVDSQQMRVVPGLPFKLRVQGFLSAHPSIWAILIEDNAGGMVWGELLHDLGVQLWIVTHSDHKWVRAQRALKVYQEGRVLHRRKHVQLERQMLGYPKVMNDDLIDTVSQAVIEIEDRYGVVEQHGSVRAY